MKLTKERKAHPMPDVAAATRSLRIAVRNVGIDWPTVSLAVAVALNALTGEKPRRANRGGR